MPTALGTVASAKINAPATGGGGGTLPVTVGLLGWWDAADASTITASAGTVSEWRDKSGNGRHFSQPDGSKAPNTAVTTINGRTVLTFTAANSDHMTQVGGSSVTHSGPITFIAVARYANADASARTHLQLGTTSLGTATGKWSMYGTDWAFGPTDDDALPHVFVGEFNGANSKLFVDGGAQTVSNPGSPTFTNATMALGANNVPYTWDGDIAEAMLYDRVLSTVERQQVESYLYWKWMQTAAPPIPTTGLAGWWDAADAATITASAGAVSQWNDKSIGGRHVVQATETGKPTTGTATRNGKNVLVFDGTDSLRYIGNTNVNVGAATCFVVAGDTLDNTVYTGFFVAHDVANDDYSSPNAITFENSVSQNLMNIQNVPIPGTGAAPFATYTGSFNGTTVTPYMNGVAFPSGTRQGPPGVANGGYVMGGRYGPANGAYAFMTGQIAEIIVYDWELPTVERQQVERYLAAKWGLTPPPEPESAPWTPQALPNLMTWISAADTASITQTGGVVTQINDLSGNGRHFVGGPDKPTTGTTTINGRNVLNFVKAPGEGRSPARLTLDAGTDILDLDTYTVLFVARLDPADGARMVSFATTASNTIPNLDLGGGAVLPACSGPYAPPPNLQSYCEAGPGAYLPIPPGVPVRLRTSKQGTTWTVAVNGVEGTATATSILDLIRYIHIGSNHAAMGFAGQFCELVVCNTLLSAADLAEWTTYVDHEWFGIGGGGTGNGATFHVPAEINDDGTVEVGAAINAWLATVPNDAVVEFTAGATYWTEETLYCAGRYDMVFEGNGARFVQHTNGVGTTPIPGFDHMWPRCRAFWLINAGGNLEFRNFNFYGGNPTGASGYSPYLGQGYEEQQAFFVDGTNGCKILNNFATRTFGDFATFANAASNGQAIGNVGTSLGRQGISVVWGTDILIQRNMLDHISRSAFDAEPMGEAWECRGITVDNNDVSYFINTFFANLGAGGSISDVTISNNRLHGERAMLIVSSEDRATGSLKRRHDYKIVNNMSESADGSPIAPIRFYDVDRIHIENNYQRVVGTYIADPTIYSGKWVHVDNCTDITIRNNIVPVVGGAAVSGVILVSGPAADIVVHCGNVTTETGTGPPVDGVCP